MESVLAALGHGPTVIFLDAGETRTTRPGVQNREFRTKALPGLNRIATGQDLAIVRCNGSREVPRPVDRRGGSQPADPDTPAAPDRVLYRLANTDEPVWLFPKSSRIYRAKGGRTGALHTPWTLPEELHHLVADDWHRYTGTEIAVTRNESWQALDLSIWLFSPRACVTTPSPGTTAPSSRSLSIWPPEPTPPIRNFAPTTRKTPNRELSALSPEEPQTLTASACCSPAGSNPATRPIHKPVGHRRAGQTPDHLKADPRVIPGRLADGTLREGQQLNLKRLSLQLRRQIDCPRSAG